MSIYQFFRNIFGVPDGRPPENSFDRPNDRPTGNEFRNPIWNLDDDDDEDDDFRASSSSSFGFRVHSNPFEIHRFFEHQMDELLKSFQSQMFDSSPHFGADGFPALGTPEDVPEIEKQQGNLREQYLKPDYNAFSSQLPFGYSEKKPDKDLDDKYNKSGLESILKDRGLSDSIMPKNSDQGVHFKTFGRSVVTKTVRRPDGSVEHHQTIRDNKGLEKTTVTRQIGDQVYTVITELDPNGGQKRTENFVNIDDGNLTEFEKKWSHPNSHSDGETEQKWKKLFPLDKFF